MSLGFVIERVFETILVFLMLGGLPIAAILLGLVYAAVKLNWSWLLTLIGLAYSALAAVWIWRSPQIEDLNTQDQIYATYFLWGALFYLTVIAIISIVIRLVRQMRTTNRPEHP